MLHPKTSKSKESKVARQLTLRWGDVLGDLGGPNTITTVLISEREAGAQSQREIWKRYTTTLETQEGAKDTGALEQLAKARKPRAPKRNQPWPHLDFCP